MPAGRHAGANGLSRIAAHQAEVIVPVAREPALALGVVRERDLDLAQLDAVAAHLDLEVGAPEVLEPAVGAPAREVAGAVEPRARLGPGPGP